MALEGCSQLTDLDIGRNDLSVTTFFPCIASNRSLRRLSLSVSRSRPRSTRARGGRFAASQRQGPPAAGQGS